jgi:hypothetical protein
VAVLMNKTFHLSHSAQIVATLYHPSMSIYSSQPLKNMLIFLYDRNAYKTSMLSTMLLDALTTLQQGTGCMEVTLSTHFF